MAFQLESRIPVLPVLYDTVERNLEFAVFVEYAAQFVRTLVTFAALPVTHGPEREHGGLSGQVADAGNYAVCVPSYKGNNNQNRGSDL